MCPKNSAEKYRPVRLKIGSKKLYLYWYIVGEACGRKQLLKFAYGAGKPGLNLKNIKDVRLVFPSSHDQRKIVCEIETRLSEADQMEHTILESLQKNEALRQSILKRAFEGKLLEPTA